MRHLFKGLKINRTNLVKALLLWLWIVYFTWLWLNQYWSDGDRVYSGSIASWADGSAHLAYASRFAYGDIFSNQLPIYAGYPFSYPFVTDALPGLTSRLLPIPLLASYQLWGILLSILVILVLFYFFRTLTQRVDSAILSLYLFLLSGGAGGWYWLRDKIDSGNLYSVFEPLTQEYTQYADKGIHMLNNISGMLLPQRAFLLGLVFGCIILGLCWQIYTSKQKLGWKHFLTLGVSLGLLPIIHPHTLIFVSLFVCWTGLLTLLRYRWQWVWAFMPAASIGLGLIAIFILPTVEGSGFTQWYPGWLAADKEINWFWFWWLNWGFFLPLGLWSFWQAGNKEKLFWSPVWLWFALANLIQFQPYIWDNSKIFLWIHLVISIFIAGWLVQNHFKSKPVDFLFVGAIIILLAFSGGLDSIRLLQFEQNKIELLSQEEIELAEFVRESTAPDAIILTSDRHNHPVSILTGRQIIMGYRGWLWTYGIDYNKRQRLVEIIYEGFSDWQENITDLGIDYIVIGPSERYQYQINDPVFDQNLELVYQSENHLVYKTN